MDEGLFLTEEMLLLTDELSGESEGEQEPAGQHGQVGRRTGVPLPHGRPPGPLGAVPACMQPYVSECTRRTQ